MGDEHTKCVTLEEVERVIKKHVNGGIKTKRDWSGLALQVVAVAITCTIAVAGAGRVFVADKIGAHENKPWHKFAGERHQVIDARLDKIDIVLSVQTAILERMEKRLDEK